MSYGEYLRWVAYRNKRGSLNVGMRVERGTAMLAMLYANRHRKEGAKPLTIYDFMPHMDPPPVTLEEAMATWR